MQILIDEIMYLWVFKISIFATKFHKIKDFQPKLCMLGRKFSEEFFRQARI